MLLSREAFARLVRRRPGGARNAYACEYRGDANDVTISGCLWRAGVLLVHHPGFWPVPPDDAWLCAIRARRSAEAAAAAAARGQATGTARSDDARLGVLSGSPSVAAAITIHGMGAEAQLAMPMFLRKLRATRANVGLVDDRRHARSQATAQQQQQQQQQAAGGGADDTVRIQEEIDVGDLLVGADDATHRLFYIPIQFGGISQTALRLIESYADGGGPHATLGPKATDDDREAWQMLVNTVTGFCSDTPSLGERCTPGEVLYRFSLAMRARKAKEAARRRAEDEPAAAAAADVAATHFGDLQW